MITTKNLRNAARNLGLPAEKTARYMLARQILETAQNEVKKWPLLLAHYNKGLKSRDSDIRILAEAFGQDVLGLVSLDVVLGKTADDIGERVARLPHEWGHKKPSKQFLAYKNQCCKFGFELDSFVFENTDYTSCSNGVFGHYDG